MYTRASVELDAGDHVQGACVASITGNWTIGSRLDKPKSLTITTYFHHIIDPAIECTCMHICVCVRVIPFLKSNNLMIMY